MSKYTKCSGCPCLNNDYEDGGSCNLEYGTSLEWIDRKTKEIVQDNPEMRSHQDDFDLIYASFDCGLLKIIKKDGGEFIPETYDHPQG